ncbi:MAG: NAD-dependent epimerase/dehydratase [Candidatus Levybacteria bacterium GW2011_GWC2_37_7]|nr:MAG: NAD-dependent epimerase/dehydratase [Candidatus Levybacteria bacterium GW2011_GWC2_37_7]
MNLKNKKILVTGGSGFLGGHVIEKLRNFDVQILAPNHKELDLIREESCRHYLLNQKPDLVIHCAGAISGLLNILKNPADIFDNNLRINLNILKFSYKFGVEKLINIGSTCAYPGELPTGYFREEEFLNGPMHESVESYGFSKRAMYIGGKAYRQQFGFNSVTLLLTNMYGPRDVFSIERSHVVSALIKKFIDAKRKKEPSVEVLGTGKAIREFLYVEDAVDAIIKAAELYDEEMPLNVGTGVETPIAELAESIKEISNYPGKIKWNTKGPDGALRKVSDISRITNKLKWKPKYDLKAGLTKTIKWFENNYESAIAKI